MWSWHIFTVFILSQLLLSLVLFIQLCSVLSDWISSSLTVTILLFDYLLQYIFCVLYELHSSLTTSVAHAAYAIKGFFSHFCVLLILFSYSFRVTAMMFQLLLRQHFLSHCLCADCSEQFVWKNNFVKRIFLLFKWHQIDVRMFCISHINLYERSRWSQ